MFADGHWRYGALWFQMFKLFFSVPRALARKSRLARTLSFTQVSEIAQVCWGECRHALRYTTFKVNLDVGQIWEVGGVLMGLTSPNSPVIVGQEFSALAASRSDSFSCWLWMLTQQWPVSFHYYSLVLLSVVSGRASNKHSSAITKRNRYVSPLCGNNNNTVGCWWSLPRVFDHCPSVSWFNESLMSI